MRYGLITVSPPCPERDTRLLPELRPATANQVLGTVPGTELILMDGIMPKSFRKPHALSLAMLLTVVAPCF